MPRHQFSSRTLCYYCGKPPPSSKEHVPPKTMFIDFECDRITVPSCDEHNTERTQDDAALAAALQMTAYWAYKNVPSSPRLTPNVAKALERAESNFHRTKRSVQDRPFLDEPIPGLNSDLPFIAPTVKINAWIRQVTAGLVWNITGEYDSLVDWNSVEVICPTFKPGHGPLTRSDAIQWADDSAVLTQQLNNAADWYFGWSARKRPYPRDIYCFDVGINHGTSGNPDTTITFRHRFYNGASTWYATVQASEKMYRAIIKVARVVVPPV